MVAAAKAPIKPVFPAPINVAPNKGKTVWFISVTQQVANVVQTSQGVQAAGAASGLKVHVFDGAGDPTKFNQGIQQAIAAHASAIIIEGINPALVTAPLAQAKAANIPVVEGQNTDPGSALPDGIRAEVSNNFTLGGQYLAYRALVDTNCNADILDLYSTLFTAEAASHTGFLQVIQSLCPKCKVTSEQVDFNNIQQSVNTIVRTALLRDPGINLVVPESDTFTLYVVPTLESIGSKLKTYGMNGINADLAYVREGKSQTVDIAPPPSQYIGWVEIDIVNRILLGMTNLPSGAIPYQMIDSSNVTANVANQFPYFDNYPSQYEKLWGVS
jgi:ribose transport system substrate-binding protein